MTVRPTDAQQTAFLETFPAWLASDDMMARIARDNPDVEGTMRDLHVAGLFLQEITLEMGFSEPVVEDLCFKLGRYAMGRDPWTAFDKLHTHATELQGRDEKKKLWTSTPVEQEMPEPTELFNGWFKMAKNSVGDEGVFPQQYHRVDPEGAVTIEAIAMSGVEMMQLAIKRLRGEDGEVAEFVMGIDMSRAEDQGFIEFPDFLAVIWYIGGEFYTGVLNYQLANAVDDEEEPAFRVVDWDNNYWSNSLREYPITDMQKAIS
jgi:hypothetical protein